MIQRIQSIYLGIATIFIIIAMFLPFGSLLDTEGRMLVFLYAYGFEANGQAACFPTWLNGLVLGMNLLAALLSFYAIFKYNNRPLQRRLGLLALLSLVAAYACLPFYMQAVEAALPAEMQFLPMFGWGVVLPFIAFVLIILARKAIYKDEQLIRAADRLR